MNGMMKHKERESCTSAFGGIPEPSFFICVYLWAIFFPLSDYSAAISCIRFFSHR
jgi:hypothetical protein